MQDIAKLVHYQLPLWGDSFNLAIVGKPGGYKIRYFGFDYSSKDSTTSVPVPNKKDLTKLKSEEQDLLARIRGVFYIVMDLVLCKEYDRLHSLPKEASDIPIKIACAYSNDVLEKFYALQEN